MNAYLKQYTTPLTMEDLKFFSSLIIDPHLKMTLYLFLGVLILRYFNHNKFLRRFLLRLDGYHQKDDVCPSYSNSVISTSAGQGVLWETDLLNNRLNSIQILPVSFYV